MVANTLAYFNTESITLVISFIVQTPCPKETMNLQFADDRWVGQGVYDIDFSVKFKKSITNKHGGVGLAQ